MSSQLPAGGWAKLHTAFITTGLFLAASWGSVSAQDCSSSSPTVNGTVTNVSCNGANNGSIDITPVGGLPPFTYAWSNGATTQDVSGLAPGSYSVTVTNGVCQTFGVELVNNSGFESGNMGFSSSYDYCNSGGCLVPEGRYAIGSNPTTYHSNFFGAPNAGSNFMVVNGIGAPNTAVWCQTITVAPNTVYNFSTWVASVNVSSPALLQFSINGTTIGNIFQAPASLNTWAQFFAVWNSGANTTANICVVNQNTTASGNDFGLDNISFMECVNCSTTRTFTVTEPAPLTATVSNNTPVSCNGLANGSATVAPAGGTMPYSVVWSNGQTGLTASNLAPGTYTANITDARGCTRSISATITQPTVLGAVGAITSSYNGQAISCNGATNGTATVTPSGGTFPYTYVWSTGATTQSASGLGAGTHTVIVRDANNCSTSVSVTLVAPPVLSSSTAVADIVNCNGGNDGSVTVNPTGGTMPYTYLWSNGATTQTAAGVGVGSYTVTVTDANGCTSNNSVAITQPAVLSTTAQVTSNYNGQNVGCNSSSGATPNGVISATPGGGTAPYTYAWSNGATTQTVNGVGAGTYTVTVTDVNGCTATASVTVTEPPVLTSNSSVTSDYNGQDVSCNGSTDGTITVTPGGGTAPYTYVWSNGATTQTATGAGAGTYTVTITDANGCTTTSSVTVTEPTQTLSTTAQVTSNYNGEDVSCNGSASGTPDGIISATPNGGTAPYTYAWSNGASTQTVNNVGAGTYTVTVTDVNGCTATASVTVTEPTVLTSNSSVTSNYNGQDVSCNGSTDGSISVTPGGGTAPYSYVWSNGATTQTVNGVGAGTYTVTITDANGCSATSSVTVTQPTQALSTTAQVTSNYNGEDVSCNGSASGTPDGIISATPGGGTAPYTYAWNNGATTQIVNNVGAGTYTVTVTDANGCTTTASVTVTEPPVLTSNSSVTSNYNGQDVSCNGSTDGTITVTPGGGTAPYTYVWSNGATTQTATGVGEGTYTVTITDANGCTTTSSVTVTQPTQALSTTAQVTSNYNGEDVSCNGSASASGTPDGIISATPAGGTAPYTYVWSNGATTQTVNNVGAGTYTVTVTDANSCTATASVTVTEPPVLTSNSSVTSNYNGQDVSCNGSTDGTITVTPGGGTAPYSYVWSNGATTQTVNNVGAGTYTVTITDANGCSATSTVTVTEPAQTVSTTAQVVSNYNGEDVSCNGSASGTPDGIISATPNGGTAPYTYAWSNGATTQTVNNVGAGTYTVTVTDANGCTANASVTVTEPPVLTSNSSVTSDYNGQDVSCNGSTDGTITVTPGGGTAPYVYVWSNGATTQTATGVGAGTYTVTITDANGCTVTSSVTVTEPVQAVGATAQVTSNYNGQDVSCNGSADGSISATATGGTAPYTYAWSNGATTQAVNNVGAGTYTVTVTDANGCTTTANVTVNQPTVLASTAQVTSDFNGQDISCNGSAGGTPDGIISATPNGGTAPYTYAWSNGATTQIVNNVGAGTYTVTVTDVNGCTATASVTVTEPPVLTSNSSVTSNYNGQDVSCNGSTDGIITVTPGGGTAPYSYVWSNGATTQTATGVGAGTYTVTITDANGCSTTSTVTVTEPAFALSSTAQVVSDYNGEDVSCNGSASGTPDGIISATPSGGTAPYTYAWSNGATTQTVNNVGAGTYTVTVTDVNGCTTTASVTVTEPPVLTSNSSVTSNYNGQDVSCNGSTDGTITVTPGGGTAPYSYVWSNGATTQTAAGVGAGMYTVIITDANGCTSNASVTVTEPAFALTSTAQVVSNYNGEDVSCNGSASGTPDGIISATPTGGTAPYTYVWSNGVTTQTVNNVGAGTYTVTVTDVNGCTTTASVTVTEPPVLTSNASVTSNYNGQDVSCNGSTDGTITVTPGGGTAPYSYVWSNGATTQTATGVGAGTYTVIITDANGCSTTSMVTVTEPAFALSSTAQVVSDYNGQDVSCNGSASGTPDGIISATRTGGTAPYTYVWSNGVTTQTVNNVGAGTYTVTVTDVNGCTATASVTVTEPPVLTSNSSVTSNYNGQDVSCNGSTDGSISVIPGGGTLPYSYVWSNGSTTQSVSGVGAGTYTVTITDANGCTSNASVTVTEPTFALSTTAQVISDYNGQDVSCNAAAGGTPDGIISATPAGGTAPYTYAWSNGATTQTVNNVGAGTYTVTVTDVNNCSTTASVTVTEPTVLSSSASVTSNYNGQDVSCNGSTDGSISVTPTGGTAPYTYQWNTGATTQSVTGLGAGTYTVLITDANGCMANASVTVTEPAQALSATTQVTSNYNGQDVSCNGSTDGSVSVTPAGGTAPYTYQWSSGATTQAASGLGAGTYTVTVTDVNGCATNASVTVTEPVLLSSSSSVTSNYNGQDVSCNSAAGGAADGAINVIATGGTVPYAYDWSNGAATQTATGVGAGTYNVTVTDANGCISTSSVTVTEPTVLGSTTSVASNYNGEDIACNGGSNGSVNVAPTGGTAPYTYDWSTGGTTPNISGVGAGTYTVIVTDVNGCTSTSSVTVTQPAAIQLAANVTQVLCFGNSTGSINLTVTGGVAPYTYIWSDGSTAEDIGGLAAGAYSVTVTDVNGCSASATIQVTQPAQVLGGLLSIDNVSCFGGSNGAIQMTASGGTAPYTYSWTNGATTATIAGVTAGPYTVTVTDDNGCTYASSGIVQQPTAPVAVSGTVTAVGCFGGNSGSIDLTVTGGTPAYSYQWAHGPQTQDVNGLTAGTYSVTVTDSKGCIDATYSVSVPQPQAALGVTGVLAHVKCYNESNGAVNITVTGGTAPYAYVWNTGAITEDIQNLSQGTYTVTVTDANGCQHTSYVANINQPAQPMQLAGTVNNISCFGGVNGGVNLTVIGGEPGYNFQWSNGSTNPNISNLPAGQYSVTVEDGRMCRREATFLVNQPPLMFINGDVQDNLCYGSPDASINLSMAGGVPGYSYQWSNGATTEDIFNLTPGNYTVSVTDANGCNGVGGFTVFGATPLNLELDSIQQIFIGNSVELTALVDGGTGSYTFSWIPDDGTLSCLDCQTTVASPLANTNYIVTVTDGNGCSVFDNTQVLVNQDIFIPNVFTPNGNGTNDTFKPVVRMAKECTFSIFNRWGELIYSSLDADHGWDGNFNGKPVQVDVYVYNVKVIFYNGIEKVFRGNVSVLR